ncbi:class I SAM-dependent methyltransferase [Roseibium sp. CAU 1637]|uniref:Class I SAM-dependent methyltransferase n=1 Tax=Roseibium limicola TaxID=2816037 RepID=A0A939EQD6_9HYPH|nr:class I SAM-dependent methyltransferase [Roseibium limicola]MBO0346811.1 class I SAM-dependent methyltransferase [Roseibium limicola]
MVSASSSDWTSGYIADINYTHGYYRELNPNQARLAALASGLAAPKIRNACELGFGQGVSVAIHGAAGPDQWFGTDFNPSQAAHARELADSAGVTLTLADEAFEAFCTRDDLPEFDFIGLHGIWSWISDANRAVIADFLRRKLAVGGLVYVSYNTLPGWANGAPLRHLMTEHAEKLAAEGAGSIGRVEGALSFTERLLGLNPTFSRANPQAPERFSKIKSQNRAYLAHEYFNRDWDPMYVADMGDWLSPAKLSYAGSAHLLDTVDAINFSAEQQQLLKEIEDPLFRETVRDFLVNQQFRRDYWIKGPRRLSSLAQAESLREVRLVLVKPRAGIPMTVNGALGEANLSDAVYPPILDLLADYTPRKIGEIEHSLRDKGLQLSQIIQAALILVGAGHAAVAQDKEVVVKARKAAQKLNMEILDRARGSADLLYLASPVTGGGHDVGRFQQLFLLARTRGRKQPADWADFTWAILKAQGQRLLKDGKALEDEAANRAELTAQAEDFATGLMPVLLALEVI